MSWDEDENSGAYFDEQVEQVGVDGYIPWDAARGLVGDFYTATVDHYNFAYTLLRECHDEEAGPFTGMLYRESFMTLFRIISQLESKSFPFSISSLPVDTLDLIVERVETASTVAPVMSEETLRILTMNAPSHARPEAAPASSLVVPTAPCEYHLNCLMNLVDNHGEHKRSMSCPKPLSCPHIGDEEHYTVYTHICPSLAGCDEQDPSHFDYFVHRPPLCATDMSYYLNGQQALPCPLKDRPDQVGHRAQWLHICKDNCDRYNDYDHVLSFWHPNVHGHRLPRQSTVAHAINVVITFRDFVLETDMSTLKNPIVDWLESPSHPVKAGGQDGTLLGPYVANHARQDLYLVQMATGEFKDFTKSQLASAQASINSPFSAKSAKVWRSPSTTVAMRKFLSKDVYPNVTGLQALQMVMDKHIPVYIIGGAVRDLAEGKDIQHVNDIDLAFGCTATEIAAIFQAKNITTNVRPNTGLFNIAKPPNCVEFEGKGMTNTAVCNAQRMIMSCDIAQDALSKDLSINALYYDILNDTIVDPSGYGLQDIRNKVLRPPCDQGDWPTWMGDHPSKIGRVIDFTVRRTDHRVVDGLIDACRTFLQDQTNYVKCHNTIPGWFANQIAAKKDQSHVAKFVQIARATYKYDFATAQVL